MAVKQLPKISDLPEPPDRLVGDQERFDVLTFNSLKAQKKMVNEDLNKTLIPALNQFAVDVNASVDTAKASEASALASKNSAASSAGTATTKAGEAAASAKAAKTSETSALASKNAAALSAESAEADRIAAEAARDEAQDLANVGYASESHAGLAKVDGKTTRADAGGVITVKDVAIGGNLGDLVSARGQIGDYVSGGSFDFNNEILDTKNIFFGNSDSTNRPFAEGPFSLQVKSRGYSVYKWISYFLQSCGYTAIPRAAIKSSYTTDGGVTYATAGWSKLLDEKHVGDGLTVNNGIISVPEYDGATASTAGTSGLVPPAAVGQQESFLTGGGEYKPALTKISDSVTSADSTTAASAKAVKTAYDRAETKLPLTGGVLDGRIGGIAGIYNADVTERCVNSALEIRENGNVRNTQSDIAYAPAIGFHWADIVAGTLALRSDGIFAFLRQNGSRAVVDCDVPYATAANKLRREGGVDTSWYWDGQGGQPGWLWGGNDGVNMYVYNPANFSVNYANGANYANSAGSANMNVYAAWYSHSAAALPAGGTWIWWKYSNWPDRDNKCFCGVAAGGSWVGDEGGIGGKTSGVAICAFKIAA